MVIMPNRTMEAIVALWTVQLGLRGSRRTTVFEQYRDTLHWDLSWVASKLYPTIDLPADDLPQVMAKDLSDFIYNIVKRNIFRDCLVVAWQIVPVAPQQFRLIWRFPPPLNLDPAANFAVDFNIYQDEPLARLLQDISSALAE